MESAKSMEYWLQQSALVCEFMVFGALAAAFIVAVKYERFWSRGRGRREDYVYDNVLWRPCWRAFHPAGLMTYRALVFLLMAALLACDLNNGGIHIYYFYTESVLHFTFPCSFYSFFYSFLCTRVFYFYFYSLVYEHQNQCRGSGNSFRNNIENPTAR